MNESEFFIMGLVEGERCSAIGRCGDCPIRIGDVFKSLYKHHLPESSDDYGGKFCRENGQFDVAMKVEAIQAYGRPLDHLSPGMTGTLVLSGAGSQILGPGLVLGLSSRRETIEPCEAEKSQPA